MNPWQFLKDALFPPRCAHCDAVLGEPGALCDKCRAGINSRAEWRCGSCRARLPAGQAGLPGGLESSSHIRKICHPDWPFILGCGADYHEPPIQSLVQALKFEFIKEAAEPLALLLLPLLPTLPLEREKEILLVPVPLHKARLRERGFNQAELIAQILARGMRLPMAPKALSRARKTKAQSKLASSDERYLNVSGCFTVPNPEEVKGKQIILIDDVITSGNTLLAAARALKDAGAGKIVAFVPALA